MRSIAWLLAILPAGCWWDTTELGHYHMELAPARYGALPFVSGSKALIGTRTCIRVDAIRLEDVTLLSVDDPPFGGCFDIAPTGPVVADGDCFVLEAPGDATFAIEPTTSPCTSYRDPSELHSDRYRFHVVPPDGIRARFEWPLDEAALAFMTDADGSPLPATLVPAPHEPVQVAAGHSWSVSTVLDDAAGERVAYDEEQAVVEASHVSGDAQLELDDDGALVAVAPSEGDVVDFALTLPTTGRLEVGRVVGVSLDHAKSLEIVSAYSSHTGFFAARAVVRDAESRAIVSAPVEWSADGPLVMYTDGPPDYAQGVDACLPPPRDAPERRSATIRAELHGLVDEADVEWIAEPHLHEGDDPFVADERCAASSDALTSRGCGCASTADAWPWLLLVPAVARRRRSTATVGAPRGRPSTAPTA